MKEFIGTLVEELMGLGDNYSWIIQSRNNMIEVHLYFHDGDNASKICRSIDPNEIRELSVDIASWLVKEMKHYLNPEFVEFKPR